MCAGANASMRSIERRSALGWNCTGGDAGVVEMDVRRDDVVDRVDADPGALERGEQARHGVVGTGVDEGGAAALDDQVGGVEERPVKAGVDDADAVADPLDERRLGSR